MLYRSSILLTVVLTMAGISRAGDKVTYDEHLAPILRNECASCHNADKKKAGLDVSSYAALLAGSDSGQIVNAGDADNSLLYKVVAHTADPNMPKGKGKLADKDIVVFKKWIAGGALENATGKAAVAKGKPRLNLSVVAAVGRPKGPLAMPRDLIVEPVVHTPRPGALLCLAGSPWAPLVALGGQHQVLLYNTDTLELVGVLPFPEGDPYVTSFSRNGAMLLVGGGIAAKSGHVALFDVSTGRRLAQVGDEFDAVLAADISLDQSMVALGGPGKVLKVYATADGQLLHTMKKHTDWVTAAAFSPDGVLLASGDRAGGLWVWEAKSGNEFYGLAGHKAAITGVCFRGDSNILASASEDGDVKLWDMPTGKLVKSWNAHGSGVLSVSFTHDGRLVTCGRDRVVRVWKPDGSALLTTTPFPDIALHATFDGDDKRIVAGDWTGSVRVFDASNGKVVGELSSDPAPIANRLDAARGLLADAQVAKDKSAAELAAARETSDKAALELQAAFLALAETNLAAPQVKANVAVAQKQVEARTQQAKAAADRLARAKPVATQAASRFDDLRAGVAHLELAQFNLKVSAAKDELASAQAELEKLNQAEREAAAEAGQATIGLRAAQLLITDGPHQIQLCQDAVAHAEEALREASGACDEARSAFQQRRELARTAGQLAQQALDVARRAPEDHLLAEAATKFKAAFDLLGAAVEDADRKFLTRQVALDQATASLASAKASLASERAAVEAAPKSVDALRGAAQVAADQLRQHKTAAARCAARLAAAKSRADQLSVEYQRMTQQLSSARR